MDPDAIWEWEYLERVSAGRYALSPGADDLARPLLTTAEAFPDNGPRSRPEQRANARLWLIARRVRDARVDRLDR